MTNITFRTEVFKEGEAYVAVCPELNVSSFGGTVLEAKNSLVEAVEAFLEECETMGSLNEVLEEAGFEKADSKWVTRKPVAEELLAIPS